MIIAPLTNANDSKTLAEKIRVKIASHDFQDIGKLTASFGVADAKGIEDGMKVISRADIAMYESKDSGRNKVSIYQDNIERYKG